MSHPRYIISHYIFAEHGSFEAAESERQRLSAKYTKSAFKIYCIVEDFDNPDLHDEARGAYGQSGKQVKSKEKDIAKDLKSRKRSAKHPHQTTEIDTTPPPKPISLSNFKGKLVSKVGADDATR